MNVTKNFDISDSQLSVTHQEDLNSECGDIISLFTGMAVISTTIGSLRAIVTKLEEGKVSYRLVVVNDEEKELVVDIIIDGKTFDYFTETLKVQSVVTNYLE